MLFAGELKWAHQAKLKNEKTEMLRGREMSGKRNASFLPRELNPPLNLGRFHDNVNVYV